MVIIKYLEIKYILLTILALLFFNISCTKEDKNNSKAKVGVKIVSTYSAYTEILNSLGAGSSIVGATKNDARLLNVKSIGTHLAPSLEAIISCNPDVVLLSRYREEHTLRLTESLEKIGVKVLSLKPSTIDETLLVIDTLGKLSGYQNEATKLIKNILDDVEFIKSKVMNLSDSSKKRVFLEVRSEPNMLTCGKKSIAYDIIKMAGGIPVFEQQKKVLPVSIEKLYDLNIDFYFQQKGIMNKNPVNPGEIEQLKQLSSIKNGEFAVIDEKLISRPGPRIGEAVKVIYKNLYE